MTSTRLPIAIAGAGIGGLTAAHALRRLGFEVEIFERAPALRAAGAGITMQINAMLVLDVLGLGDAVQAAGACLRRAEVRTRAGRVLAGMDLGELAQRFGAPGVGIDRGRLTRILAAGLEDALHVDAAVAGFEADDEGVDVTFADGAQRRYAALVGCDGLHSQVRRTLLDDAPDPLRYAGYTTWRGIAHEPPAGLDPTLTIESFGGRRRFGQVPIGHGEVYWFAVERTEAGGVDGAQPRRELLERFADWPEAVTGLIEATPDDALLRTDVFDREPRRVWGRGLVTLLGDAAHPMTPNLGQGGGQAVEDALALAVSLREAPSIEAGLRAYEAARCKRANEVVVASWRMGRLAQLEGGAACWLRNTAMAVTPTALKASSLVRLYAPAVDLVARASGLESDREVASSGRPMQHAAASTSGPPH